MDVEMTYTDPNSLYGGPLPPQQMSQQSIPGGVDSGNVTRPSPTSSVTSFFSMDVDPDNQSGRDTPIAGLDIEDPTPGDMLSHIPGMFRILDLVGEQSSGGIGKHHL
jgi:hypothetical protein